MIPLFQDPITPVIQGTAEAISLLDDPILRILISLLFLMNVVTVYLSYRFINSLMKKIDAKDKEVVESYSLIYTDSKANLELVLAFGNKFDEHASKDDLIRQDIHELLKITTSINIRLDELTKQ